MNREQAKNLLPVIEAFANGEEIQFKDSEGKWHTNSWISYSFDSDPENYRVKPKPRELWVMFDSNMDQVISIRDTEFQGYTLMREVTDETDM